MSTVQLQQLKNNPKIKSDPTSTIATFAITPTP